MVRVVDSGLSTCTFSGCGRQLRVARNSARLCYLHYPVEGEDRRAYWWSVLRSPSSVDGNRQRLVLALDMLDTIGVELRSAVSGPVYVKPPGIHVRGRMVRLTWTYRGEEREGAVDLGTHDWVYRDSYQTLHQRILRSLVLVAVEQHRAEGGAEDVEEALLDLYPNAVVDLVLGDGLEVTKPSQRLGGGPMMKRRKHTTRRVNAVAAANGTSREWARAWLQSQGSSDATLRP